MANEHLTQFCTAWALARRYHHGWAADRRMSFMDIVAVVHEASTPEEACELIRELYNSLAEGMSKEMAAFHLAGIPCPELVGRDIVHQTGSGRLTWTIRPDGSVTFVATTPRGVVAQADVSAPELAYSVEGAPYVRRSVNMWAREARPRHIVALAEAVDVLSTVPGCPDGDALELGRFTAEDPIIRRDCPDIHVDVDLDGSKSTMGPGVWFEGSWPCAAAGIFVPLFAPITMRDLAREFAYLANTVDPEYAGPACALGAELYLDYHLRIRSQFGS